jgi:hypothetical protein
MTPDAVARIVERRGDAAFVDLLRSADPEFDDAGFEPALADALRAEPQLTNLWATWSADQRWTPSAYVEGNETGWYDSERQHVRVHPDSACAVADFVHRMAAWSARREVIAVGESAAAVERPVRVRESYGCRLRRE